MKESVSLVCNLSSLRTKKISKQTFFLVWFRSLTEEVYCVEMWGNVMVKGKSLSFMFFKHTFLEMWEVLMDVQHLDIHSMR